MDTSPSGLNIFLKSFVKIAISCIAIIILFRLIPFQTVFDIIRTGNIYFLLAGILFLFFSQVLSAVRLNIFLKQVGVLLSTGTGIGLYLAGMLYNLVIPGGIGGDGYKIYKLKNQHDVSLSQLLKTVFSDRLSGLVAILICSLLLASVIQTEITTTKWLWVLIVPVIILYFIISNKLFHIFRPALSTALLFSAGVQTLQMISVYCIARAIGADINAELFLIFLISSIAAVIPITVGGLGSREFVFLYGANLLHSNAENNIAISLLFYVSTIIIAISGLYFILLDKQVRNK